MQLGWSKAHTHPAKKCIGPVFMFGHTSGNRIPDVLIAWNEPDRRSDGEILFHRVFEWLRIPSFRIAYLSFGNCVLFFETRSQRFEVHGDAGVCVSWGCSQILHRPGD